MSDFNDRSSKDSNRSKGGDSAKEQNRLKDMPELTGVDAKMGNTLVQNLLDGLKLCKSIEEAYQVFEMAKEQHPDMHVTGQDSRWISGCRFRVSTHSDAKKIAENLYICRDLNITCAPQLKEIIFIPDQTAVVALMFCGCIGESPRPVKADDVFGLEVAERYVDNVKRLGAAGLLNAVSGNPGHWLLHPASGDILIENWTSLNEAGDDEVTRIIQEIRAYF